MNNAKYWQNRAISLERLMQDRTDQTVIEINKLYDSVVREMDLQIHKVFGRYLDNGGINQNHALKLLNEHQTKETREKLLALLSSTSNIDIKREIIAALDAPAYANRISRLEALKDQVYFEARMVGVRELNLVSKRLIDTIEQAYYHQTFDVQRGIGLSYNFETISSNRIKAMLAHDWTKGGNYSKRIWRNNQEFAIKARDIIEKGVLTGQSAVTMRDSLVETVGMNNDRGARYVSNRLIRTEISYFSAQGQKLSYEEANIKKYRFIATLDLVTSDVCKKLDLKTFEVNSAKAGVNLPPMHPHCRSTTSPYIVSQDYSKLQRRARNPVTGKNILVPADMSYEQWYGKFARGNEKALSKEKQRKNIETDKKQFEKYQVVLGNDTPVTLEKFKQIKYNDDDAWRLLKVDYRRRNYLQKQLVYVRNGGKQFVPNGTKFSSTPKTIAGADVSVRIRNVDALIKKYGGTEKDWNKRAVSIKSDKYIFDVHWYEKEAVQYEMKLKYRKERKP